ncbi:plasmid mobilization protein [Streptomyces fragilis]|uniref:Mobilization protein n=1 Tax=Streptomyces fragilis TaxID=67301 RepID=A0ABV2YC81_9ACTN|nr:hypothetical protein [Streptomyces fragilis]
MTAPNNTSDTPDRQPNSDSVSARASWGESIASADLAPSGDEEDPHRGARVKGASTEGGPKHQQEELSERRGANHRTRVRQRPRQPSEKKRLRQPAARFNEDEYTLLQAAAARCQLSVAGFLARSALAAARDLDRTAARIADERDVITALFESRRRLGWAGNNLNQAMKAVNSGIEAPQLEAAVAAVRRAADTVHEAATALIAHNRS